MRSMHEVYHKKGHVLGTIVGAALLTPAPFSLQWSQKTVALSLDSADARVGRPLTPMSVAGVHRRAYRHAAYGTAAAYGSYGSYYNTVTPGYGYGGSYRPGYAAARGWRSIAPAGTEARATRKRPWAGVSPRPHSGRGSAPTPRTGGHGRRQERVSGGKQPQTREKAEKPAVRP